MIWLYISVQFSSVQSLSCVQLFATPWIAACQASLSITNSWSSLRLTSIESVMPSSHLILCRPLLLLPPIPPSFRVFSNESTLHIRWPKYWSFYIYIYIHIYILNSWHFIWEVKSIKGVGSGYGNPGGNMERVKWMVAQFQNILTVNTESNMNDYKNKLVKTLEHAERWL